jgi:hypothetical protein
LALVGLIVIGTSGTTMRQRRNHRLPIGIALMAVGVLIAALGSQLLLMLGWTHP